MRGLTNGYVEDMMKSISLKPEKFKGVKPCDIFLKEIERGQLKLLPKNCIILNLSSSNHSGSHFVAIFMNSENKAEYFDSYGLNSFDSNINKGLKHAGIKITAFDQGIQDASSDFCGLFCIGYLLWRQAGLGKKEFSNLFHKTEKNHNNKKISNLLLLFIEEK